MNYIYDILLNFQKEFYEFYEWNTSDEITHIRKIPLIRVSDKELNIFKEWSIRFEKDFIEKIYNKTERFKKVNVVLIPYVFLASNGKEAMALKLGKNGIVTHKSSLLLDEEEEIIDLASDLKIDFPAYTILNKNETNYFQTRNEKENAKLVLTKLNELYTHKEDEKLRFLYLECFNCKEEDITKIFNILKKETNDHGNNYKKIINFFKLINQK